MNGIVTLKGNRYGLSVYISNSAPFNEIKEKTAECFQNANKTFGKEKVAIGFEGRLLSNAEREELIDVIAKNTTLDIVCVMDFNAGTEEKFRKAVEKFSAPEYEEPEKAFDVPVDTDKQNEFPEKNYIAQQENSAAPENTFDITSSEYEMSNGEFESCTTEKVRALEELSEPVDDIWKIAKFYKGNVRSGLVLNEECSLVIIGDVNAGAEVISGGNIIVLGALRGNVFAGTGGHNNCFVSALIMNPGQIRIGDYMGWSPDSVVSTTNEEHEPMIAYVKKDERIAVELISRSVLNEIII